MHSLLTLKVTALLYCFYPLTFLKLYNLKPRLHPCIHAYFVTYASKATEVINTLINHTKVCTGKNWYRNGNFFSEASHT
jgi:hypothetical protein